MDNLTHSAVGILLGRAGLNRLHPRAALLLFLSANAPDGDAISVLSGTENYFLYHRWMTHSIVAVPVVALVAAAAVRLLYRNDAFSWLRAWLVCVCGVASHLLLDLTNPYGIRLWLPFDEAWPALHMTSVVDVWIWLVLGTALLWPALSRLVASEIGARKPAGRGWAIAALIFLLIYNSGRSVLHQQAISTQMANTYNGESPRRAWAFPTHVNPMLWSGVAETGSAWAVHDVRLGQALRESESRILYKTENSPAIESARRHRLIATFLRFSPTPHWRVTPAPEVTGGTRVEVQDLRFGFRAIATVDATGQVASTSFSF